ncbi:MAG: hypothetical protein ABI671_08560 [Burkholderiales bacterium]
MSIEGDAALADGDLGQRWTYLFVEPVAVHAEVRVGVTATNEAGKDHVTLQSVGRARAKSPIYGRRAPCERRPVTANCGARGGIVSSPPSIHDASGCKLLTRRVLP